ncbi:unnamed protein product [Kuraishia capsulata CBS 1993]|uniref:Bromodomain associated domain-containing protein n=1 Tax=Kuraishia capsulata CBS 1993 TaxID=1382522 RepID=W6MLF8_9ASCO|nr:uncharacterized protein KUCA_T00001612001 [Kuraishia capsulata CBS 1993]CDK25642.1 unnamed protein product [Kuraishia capsulata CBS 1993]
MSNEEFYFALLRISIAQLLRSHGFDKCSNKSLDILTDTYIRFMQLIVKNMAKLSETRGQGIDDVTIQDLAEALVEVKLIRPSSKLDPYDLSPFNATGVENFEKWFLSATPDRAREVARPNREIAEDIIKESLGFGETSVNNFKNILSNKAPGTETTSQVGEIVVDEDWIQLTLRGQLDGKDTRFKGSVLVDYLPKTKEASKEPGPSSTSRKLSRRANHDFLVLGNTPENLIDHLPYIKESDSESEPDEFIEELNGESSGGAENQDSMDFE